MYKFDCEILKKIEVRGSLYREEKLNISFEEH